jgi:hypothetical protein
MWGSVVASLLFWSFANEVTTVEEAKKYCEWTLFFVRFNDLGVFFLMRITVLQTKTKTQVMQWISHWCISNLYISLSLLHTFYPSTRTNKTHYSVWEPMLPSSSPDNMYALSPKCAPTCHRALIHGVSRVSWFSLKVYSTNQLQTIHWNKLIYSYITFLYFYHVVVQVSP